MASKFKDELIEVMIKLRFHERDAQKRLETPINEINTRESTSTLKAHSERKQLEVIDFLNKGNGEVINTF